MKNWNVVIAVVARSAAAIAFIGAGAAATAQTPSMWVTGYYPRWAVGSMPPEQINWAGMTHVIHFGANPVKSPPYLDVLVNADDSLQLEWGGGWVWPNNSVPVQSHLIQSAHENGVRVLLSVGGIWGDGSKAMEFVAEDSIRCRMFASAAAAYARRKGYDGIEIDWEPPSADDLQGSMVRYFRGLLDQWSPHGILALAAANGYHKRYDVNICNAMVDQINIMMYDYHTTPSWVTRRDVTYFNAPLDSPEAPGLEGNQNYKNTSPQVWIDYGFDRKKLAVGVPFYGYCYKGRSAPGQPRTGAWPQYIPYEVTLQALASGGERHWDSGAKVPWLSGRATKSIGWYVKEGEEFYITYDDPQSLAEKVQWAKSLNIGGIMIYELWQGWVPGGSNGEKDPLLRAVVNALYDGKPPAPKIRTGTKDAPRVLPPPAGEKPRGSVKPAPVHAKNGSAKDSGRSVPPMVSTKPESSHTAASPAGAAAGVLPRDVTALGKPIALVMKTLGGGSRDIGVICDNMVPNEGSNARNQQYETLGLSTGAKEIDWVGYEFSAPHTFVRLVFQEGMLFPNGGWLERAVVQVRNAGRWSDVADLASTPPFQGRNGRDFQTFVFTFSPARGDAIRLAGTPGGETRFFTIAELRVYEAAPQ